MCVFVCMGYGCGGGGVCVCACVCMHVSCMFDDFDESKKRKMDRKKWIRRKTKKKKHYGGELGKRKIKFSLT